MFKIALPSNSERIPIFLDGEEIKVPKDLSVAAVLLISSNQGNRLAPNGGGPRSAYCMIGNCYECLVEIDGVSNQQGCLIEVKEGMRIVRQMKSPSPYDWRSSDE